MPTLECDQALLLAETGHRAAAKRSMERLCRDDFAVLPRDSVFLASLAILGEAAVTLDDVPRAEQILAALSRFPTRNLIQGVPVAWGSAAWHLARLARTAGDGDAADAYEATAERLHLEWGAGPFGPPPVMRAAGASAAGAWVGLSSRELTVVDLLAAGRSNKEIAATLTISVHTAERHVANIFRKLGVRSRSQVAVWAHRQHIDQLTT